MQNYSSEKSRPWWQNAAVKAVAFALNESLFYLLFVLNFTIGEAIVRHFSTNKEAIFYYGLIVAILALFATVIELDIFQRLTRGENQRPTPWTWMIVSPIVAFAWFLGIGLHSVFPAQSHDDEKAHQIMEENRKIFADPDVQRGARLLNEFQRIRATTTSIGKSDRSIMLEALKSATSQPNR